MRHSLGWALAGIVGYMLLQSCSSTSRTSQVGDSCVPGTSQSCTGPGHCEGFQICNDEGTGFDPCDCELGTGGSSSANSNASGSGGSGTGGTAAGGEAGEPGSGSGGTTSSAGSSEMSTVGSSNSSGGSGGSGAISSGGSSGSSSSAGGTGGSNSSGSGGTGGSAADCTDTPTVMVLVDASSSMWDNMFWDPLRDAVLGAVEQLDGKVRFGLATFSGLPGSTCPLELNLVDGIGLGLYDDIESFYTAIEHPGMVSETPTAAGLHEVTKLLVADGGSGRQAILLVTDGNPDYCDNGVQNCRSDTTVRVIQDAHAAGIDTLVAALPDPSIDQNWLTAMANAGAGNAVSAPSETAFCDALPTATAEILSDIDPDVWPMASYEDTMGPTEPIALGDSEDMTATLVEAITTWATCGAGS